VSAAVAIRIVKPDDALLIEVQDEAEKHGLVLITDGHELKYMPKGWPLPERHTYFRLRPKHALRVVPKGLL
jgi:hypothetical protein